MHHDPGLAEELLRPLGTDDDRVALMLGRALSYRQQFEEAEEVLSGREPLDLEVAGELISIRAQNMAFGLGRLDEARKLLQAGAARIEDSDLRARLTSERAMASAIQGDFVDTMSASDAVLSYPGTSAFSRASAYVSLTVALAMTGDCERMEDVMERLRWLLRRDEKAWQVSTSRGRHSAFWTSFVSAPRIWWSQISGRSMGRAGRIS